MINKKKIAIIGASAPSCILALYLFKKNYDVTLLEKTSKIGGAWANDNHGPKFSNIIYPINKDERKIYKKALVFFKKKKIRFKKDIEKSLFSKEIVKATSCDLSKMYEDVKKKIKLKTNLEVKLIEERSDNVIINNKYNFSHVIFPTYVSTNKILITSNKLHKKIHLPFLKMNKALHVRLIVKDFVKKNFAYKKLKIGPMDRFQIKKIKKDIYQINGRVLIDWKNKNKNLIKEKIVQENIFKKILKIEFFNYISCIRNFKHMKILNNKLKHLKRIHYTNTFTLLEFFSNSILNKKIEKNLKYER